MAECRPGRREGTQKCGVTRWWSKHSGLRRVTGQTVVRPDHPLRIWFLTLTTVNAVTFPRIGGSVYLVTTTTQCGRSVSFTVIALTGFFAGWHWGKTDPPFVCSTFLQSFKRSRTVTSHSSCSKLKPIGTLASYFTTTPPRSPPLRRPIVKPLENIGYFPSNFTAQRWPAFIYISCLARSRTFDD